ncbi:Mut7-C RNAse domain-containing protein [Sulfurisphaera javensis]|uniref:Mut7-C RNAse domain-containing protein n=1 Tax=Sulfurisphaera javensis TaxID=2049879 RepID=A0AAT9GQZ6_9CREN
MQSQKFIVDAMLGKLARWLRILGYDTLYSNTYEDWKILKIAEENDRIIITRDRGLCVRARKKGLECFLVYPTEDFIDILTKLAIKYKIDLNADPNFSRCTECNGVLEKIDENRWKCTKCGKEYWKGSHWRTIENILIRARSKIKNNESRAISSG